MSAGAYSSKNGALKCQFKITVGHYNLSIVATKFKDGLTESLADISANLSTNVRGACKGDKWDTRIVCKGFTTGGFITADSHHIWETVLC